MPVLHATSNLRYTAAATTFSSAYTIEFWVYFRSDVSTGQYMFAVNSAANPTASVYSIVNMSGDKISHWIGGSANAVRTSTNALATGRWYHIVFTYDGSGNASGCLLYINGVNDAGTSSASPASPSHDGPYSWGGRVYTAIAADDRKMIDALLHKGRVYKRVLTAGEIAARYASPGTVDYVTTYASDLVIRADFDSDTNSNGVAATTSTGTPVMTSRPILDLPGIAWFNDPTNSGSADSAGVANTITSTRIATMGNFAATGANATETSSSGPVQITNTLLKVGVAHAAHSSAAARYNSAATGSGPTWDNRNITVFGWIAPVSARGVGPETIMHLGDPATASSAVLELSQTYSNLRISRAGGATEVGTSDIPMQTTLPRFFAVRCTASERTLMVDSIRKNLGSAFTSATSTGLRIGAPLGGTSSPFVGDLYNLCIAQRPLSDAELDALLEYGKDVYQYTDPTWGLMAEGSSTMWGTSDSSANNEGILSQIKTAHPEAYVVNHANAIENVAHFDNGYAAGVGASVAALKTAYGWGDSDFLGILQVYGNDYDQTGTITLLDRYENGGFNYVSVYDKWVADIGTIYIMWPVVRTDYVTDPFDETASNALDESREEDVRSFVSLTMSDYPQFKYIVRPSAIEAASATAAVLQDIAGGGYYIGDETHLTPAGMRLYGTRLLQITNSFSQGSAGGTFRSRNYRRMGVR